MYIVRIVAQLFPPGKGKNRGSPCVELPWTAYIHFLCRPAGYEDPVFSLPCKISRNREGVDHI